MKRVFASLALALCVATGFAQTQNKPIVKELKSGPPIALTEQQYNDAKKMAEKLDYLPKVTAPSDSQKKDVQLAIKDFQISQLQAQTAQTAVQDAQRKVMATVEQLRKELKLDDTWDFDYTALHFVKRPEPAKETKAPEKK